LFIGLALTAVLSAAVAAQDITDKDLLAGVADPSRWLSIYGEYSAQHHSPLVQITPANATALRPVWTFQSGVIGNFEATPIVVDGILYTTGTSNNAWAVDGKTGKRLWSYQRRLPEGLKVCCGPVNRGFAVYHDRLYMTTLDAHLVALEMKTGKIVWDVEIADYKLGYASTVAPLVVQDKLIVGTPAYTRIAGSHVHDPMTATRVGLTARKGEPGSRRGR
jgi:alcohol dehydrogenase (cytochrome c)